MDQNFKILGSWGTINRFHGKTSLLFFFFLRFIYLLRERERVRRQSDSRQVEGQRKRENPEADFLLSVKPDVGLDPRILR